MNTTWNVWPRRVAALMVLSVVAFGTDLTEAEKKEGLAQLAKSKAGVIAATDGLTDEQWKFKPAADRWSIAETMEHIIVVERALLERVSEEVMKSPPLTKLDPDRKTTDQFVLRAIADRSKKATAPDAVLPTKRWTPQELADQFLKVRTRTVEYLQTTPGLRDHAAESPLGRTLDGYQWLLYISAHSERHTKQILEVKADPNFPKQ